MFLLGDIMQKYEIEKLIKKVEKINDYELLYFVKKLIRERNYLNELVNTDTLTGLNNRRVLGDIKDCSAVVMCDIDDYKQVNDLYGHSIGDSVIKSIGNILKLNVRESDCVCRYGGDEFLIVFIDCPEHIIYKRIETIRKIAESSLLLSNGEKITMSFGIAINSGNDLEDLINKADIALYQSKESGKNRIKKYESYDK